MLKLYDVHFMTSLDYDVVAVLTNYLNSLLPMHDIAVSRIETFVNSISILGVSFKSEDEIKQEIEALIKDFNFEKYLTFHASMSKHFISQHSALNIIFKLVSNYAFDQHNLIKDDLKKLTHDEFNSLDFSIKFTKEFVFANHDFESDIDINFKESYGNNLVFLFNNDFINYAKYEYSFLLSKLMNQEVDVTQIVRNGILVLKLPKIDFHISNKQITKDDFNKSVRFSNLYETLSGNGVKDNYDFNEFKRGIRALLSLIKKHKIIIH